MDNDFWRHKSLSEMSREEWESICDGCAKCCLEKIEDDDTGEIFYTDVACRLLDVESCRCSNYSHRQLFVADCVSLRPGNVLELPWIPPSCAYRRLAEGRGLAPWHPLVCNDPEAVHQAGVSVRGRAVPQALAGDLEDHIVDWGEKEKIG